MSVNVENGSTLTVTDGANILAGGQLTGGGTVAADVVNDGRAAPGKAVLRQRA